MLKRYKYRAYPTSEQKTHFAQTFGCTRVVYNKYVEANKSTGKITSYNEASAALTALKKLSEYEWLNDVSAVALQQSLKDAAAGVNLYFKNKKKGGKRKVGLPTFKKRSSRQAFRMVGTARYKVKPLNNKWSGIILPKLTEPLKFKLERPLPNPPSSVTIVRESNGEYYVSFVVEVAATPLPFTDQHAAGDLGLTTLLTVVNNNGEVKKFNNPRYLRKAEAALKHAQQLHSKKLKGSKNKEKARIRVAKRHSVVTNQKKDHYNKLALGLLRENQTFSLETLNISGMVKNRKLARGINDASWGILISCFKNMSIQYGRKITFIDPWYASTQTCSACKVKRSVKLALSEREWACESCGTVHDRDVNAAQNILYEGNKIRTAGRAGLACGEEVRRDFIVARSSVKQELYSSLNQH